MCFQIKSNAWEVSAIVKLMQGFTALPKQKRCSEEEMTAFISAIGSIEIFVTKLAKVAPMFQYFEQADYAEELEGLCSELCRAFDAILAPPSNFLVDSQELVKAARWEDQDATKRALRAAAADPSRLAQSLGVSGDAVIEEQKLVHFEHIKSQSDEEAAVLCEIRKLLKIIRTDDWILLTFRPNVGEGDKIRSMLHTIDSILHDLRNLLPEDTQTELMDPDTKRVQKVKILLGAINAHKRDAVLVRSFQKALKAQRSLRYLLLETL